MTRHLFFWIGFFAAALLVVPIAAGIMGAAEQELRRAAVIVFAVISGLVLALVLVLVFRGWILRRLLGRTEATLADVSASLIDGVSAASAGDRRAATAHAQSLVQRGMGWYAWTNFYRWVIATAVALLLAFGAFVGTALLFEQNRKLGEQTEVLRAQTERLAEQTGFMQAQTELMQSQTDRLAEQMAFLRAQNDLMQAQARQAERQNELVALTLVRDLRDQMISSSRDLTLDGWRWSNWYHAPGARIFYEQENECALRLVPDYRFVSPPSAAMLLGIQDLAEEGMLTTEVRRALELMLSDEDGRVALGALIVLDRLGVDTQEEIAVSNLFVEGLDLQGTHRLSFDRSVVAGLNCPECTVELRDTIFDEESTVSARFGTNVILIGIATLEPPTNLLSVIYFMDAGVIRPPQTVALWSDQFIDDAFPYFYPGSGPFFCGSMRWMADQFPFLSFDKGKLDDMPDYPPG